jgi:hypothetical protein
MDDNEESKEKFLTLKKHQSSNLISRYSSAAQTTSEEIFRTNRKVLTQKFSVMGHTSLNLYQILKNNDDLIEKQRYNLFTKYTCNNYREKDKDKDRDKIIKKAEENEINEKHYDLSTKTLPCFENIELLLFDEVNEYFEDKIYTPNGKEIGSIEGSICIKNLPILKQVMFGVHTEAGYLSSSYLGLAQPKTSLNPKEYLPEELKIIVFNMNKLFESIEENNFNIKDYLKIIKAEIKKTSKEPILFFDYLSKIDILMKGQTIILNLGKKLLKLIRNLSKQNRDLVFDILTLIGIRGEFDLERMSIIIDKKINNYMIICELFTSFLKEILEFCLDNLSEDIPDSRTKKFVECMLAISYFRIPNVSCFLYF